MKILFLCTAHNSLSQRLGLALSRLHHVTIEYALSEETMLSAVSLAQPDLIICPFLTTLVPRKIYADHMTLIIHPGPPGDIGPSALDWVLMGDDGTVDDAKDLLKHLDTVSSRPGRSHWGITVLQAIEEFDAGPVWAYDQFEIDIDQPGLTKSELYRGPVTAAVIAATLAAISRVQAAATGDPLSGDLTTGPFSPGLQANPKFRLLSVGNSTPFQGGRVHHRPLLKGAQREFDVNRHDSDQISRRIRCGDSQPGVLSRVFGGNLYIYGGMVEDNAVGRLPAVMGKLTSKILGVRSKAICISACDGKGVWITHTRRPKTKYDKALWPKVPALSGLMELGLIKQEDIESLYWPPSPDWCLSSFRTFQEVWIDIEMDDKLRKTAYLYFDFYNGAMSTDNCSQLIAAMDYIVSLSTMESPVQAVVLMGGSYFSNGIALNVIEAAHDPATESWLNINRIDDVVYYLLHELPSRGILTIAGVRGNAAAGGVALAAACDVVIAGANIVLNPAYRAVGLFGSEFHTLSYYGRCGHLQAMKLLRSMTPICPLQAQAVGLVDYVFPGTGELLDDYIRTHVTFILRPGILHQGNWKRDINLSFSALALARAHELGEMSLDFWSPRAVRYHTRRFDFVRKVRGSQTPLRFATHRRKLHGSNKDEEERDTFDSVEHFRKQAIEQLVSNMRLRMSGEFNDIMAKGRQRGSIASRTESTASRESIASRDSRDSGIGMEMAAPPERDRDSPSAQIQAQAERKTEPIFSCYYTPPPETENKGFVLPSQDDMRTPPETPLSPGETVDRFFSMI